MSSMRMKPDETFEDWTERVHSFELEYAKKELLKGVSVEQVLENMSKRISQKLMHPVYTAIRNSKPDFDIEASKKAYEEAYLKKNSPKADHLTED